MGKTENVELVAIERLSENEKGGGFTSTLEAIKVKALVNGQNKSYDWVVKSLPRDPNRALMSLAYKADEREAEFYGVLVPKIAQFLTSKQVSGWLPYICSTPYSSWTEKEKVLIMDNLKETGWRDAINKKAGLDIHHVRLVIKWLASFHAVTYAFFDQYGIVRAKKDFKLFFWKYDDHFDWVKETEPFRSMTNDNQRTMFKGFEEKNPSRNYCNYLEDMIEKHLDMGTAANKVKDSKNFKLLTLCHHDPWFNNMMFKYNDAEAPTDVVLFDFQIPSYASPALDLSFFLDSSTTGELRREYLPHILTLYHTTFMHTLESLNTRVDFTYEDLLEDYRKAKLHGVNFALTALPTILAEKKEDMFDPEEWMKAMNETDEETKNKKLKEMTDQQNANFGANNIIADRMKEIVDEWIDAGVSASDLG